MKARYKFIHFSLEEANPPNWGCFNNRSGDLLGTVDFDKQWKNWVFIPEYGTIFSMDCLEDIISFTKQL